MEQTPKDDATKLVGLTDSEVNERLLKFGRNCIAEKPRDFLLLLLGKFWAPIPWMLEITIVLQLVIGKIEEAIIVTLLLVFNSCLSFFQEERTNKALSLLKARLTINARVLRNNKWQLVTAKDLVPDDCVYLRMGDIAPADIRIISGNILCDQSALTGEAFPVEGSEGRIVYSGSTIKRGEIIGIVIATGTNTCFGKTVELVHTAKTQSHVKDVIFTIIKYLVAIAGVLACTVLIYSFYNHIPLLDVVPYLLILLVASVPIALPATFSLATALGAYQLVKKGVLVTRLSAIEEAAVMDVISLDKTGTITSNKLQVVDFYCCESFSEEDLLRFAAWASDEATQDPIDMAILSAIKDRGISINTPANLQFIPFDSINKRTEAIINQNGKTFHILKGATETLIKFITNSRSMMSKNLDFGASGYRIIAVAVSDGNSDNSEFKLVGLLAFNDPPRQEAPALIEKLHNLGLRVQMITGDSAITAKKIAELVGIGEKVCQQNILAIKTTEDVLNYDIFANVFPQDKFNLVQTLQLSGHVVGMTGDGVNDAPALKQAEVGIAVANAVDVAKSAASVVLTQPGFSGIVDTIEASRQIHKRMLTYILNKIIKSFEISIFLSLGVILSNTLIITPALIVLLLFTNDFVTMSIATDNVSFSPRPEKWRIANLIVGGGLLAILMLVLSFAVFFFGRDILHLPLAQLQTLVFLLLVFTGQGNVYLVRERGYLWSSLPSKWLIASSLLDILIVIILATKGIMMAAISPLLIIVLLAIVIIYLLFVDLIKVKCWSLFQLE